MFRRRLLPVVLAVLLVLGQQSLTGAKSAQAVTGSPIQYVYDSAGRLVGVVDPATQTATMAYDADGNITSIARYNSTIVSIIGATPKAGPVGRAIKIYGTAFSATPSQNAVTFNGVAAIVTASTVTALDVTVPAGATTGVIRVTAPAGTATSASPFTVLGPLSPTVTGVSATVIDPGGSLTVTGTNFQTTAGNNTVVLGHYQAQPISATSSSLVINAPPVGAGPITVATANGKAASSVDVFVPPSPYSAAQVSATGRAQFGQLTSITIGTPGTIGLLALDATAGQRVTFSFDESGINGCCNNFALYSFDGGLVFVGGAGFVDVYTIPVTGTYVIAVDPGGSNTGIARVTVNNVPADITTNVSLPAVGSSVQASVTTTIPGQNANVTFSVGTVTSGMRVALDGSPVGSNTNNMSLIDPNGVQLWGGGMGNWTGDIAPTVAGTYTIKIDYLGTVTGTASVTLYNVPLDATTSLTFPAVGSSVQASVTTTTPGQSGSITFSIGTVTAGMRIALNGAPVGSNTNNMFVIDPVAAQLWGGGMGNWTGDIAPTVAGTYTIKIDYLGMVTGTAGVTLYNVPLDATTSMSFPVVGSPTDASVLTTTPGQDATITFAATTGAAVTFTFDESGISGCCNQFIVVNPDTTTLSSTGAGTVGPVTLTQTGTYTIKVDYAGLNIGTASVTLTAPTSGAALFSGSGHTATLPNASPNPKPSATKAPPLPTPPSGGAQSNGAVSQPDWLPRTLPGGNVDPQSYQPLPRGQLADLRAPPGVTALAGRSLQLNGEPLVGVTFSIGNRSTRTDGTGRFLLTRVPAGRQVLRIDGSTADRSGAAYGIYEAAIQITAAKTNALGFINWMTRLDMVHAVTIPSPTKVETVITTPSIPGLEIHLPAGTVIKDDSGKVITQLSITAIPVNRPPFPLPLGVQVPIYFTVQPGSTYILPKGASIVYPNFAHQIPGSKVEFWDYDPDQKGWYVYGHGTVTKDGKQVVPDPGVVVWQFSGAMINSGFLPWLWGQLLAIWNWDGDPVDLSSGDFVMRKTDLALPGSLPITFNRVYNAVDTTSRSFGIGSTVSYDINLYSTNQYQVASVYLPGYGPINYVRTSPGTGFADAVFQTTTTPSMFYKSTIAWNGDGWNLTLKDGTTYVFGENAPLQSISDAYGNRITLLRSQGKLGNITTILSTSGRWIKLTYDASNRITQAKDNSGRAVLYGYDASGRLQTVTDPNDGVTTYGYDTSNRMTTITDPRNLLYLTNHYDGNGRVSQQDLVDTSKHYLFTYVLDGSGKVTKTDVTDPRGVIREVTFDGNGFTTSDKADTGGSNQQLTQIQRQPGTGFLTSITDSLNRVTQLGYDGAGNVNSVTQMAGTAEARSFQLTYESALNRLHTYTDSRLKTTTINYDDVNRTQTIIDPLGHQTVISLNSIGQPISVTDALQHSSVFAYTFGDLTSVTDPLGDVSSAFFDGAGRTVAVTDALGGTTLVAYDPLNETSQVTDPLGQVTSFTYDPNGNLKSVKDPRLNTTSYTYDSFDRPLTRVDPDNRTQTYNAYDADGNITSFTDQKGQITCFRYDNLNRQTFIGYAANTSCPNATSYQSTITYGWDVANRLHTLTDSAAGSITRDWDNYDRPKDEITPQGTVAYTFDIADRPLTITVPGQTAYTYAFDDANRLQTIKQGATTLVTETNDNADRLTSKQLPDAIIETYSHDSANRLTGITYTKGTTTLGNLTYGSDASGQVSTVAGTWARTSLPTAVASATFDAANQILTRSGISYTYDANGNVTNDGSRTYSWNARDQLTGTGGAGQSSFTYDGAGRRIKLTSGATTTSFLYAGANPVQEIQNNKVTANQIPSPVPDEYLARTDSKGVKVSYLSDRLGSTVALGNSAGTVQTQYTYDPYGATTVSGTTSANTADFTGQQNDPSGLYYLRARYYSPAQQRFISGDPISFGGGDSNLYAYVGNSPTNQTDPSGEFAILAPMLIGCAIGAVTSAVGTWANNSLLAGRKTTVGDLVKSAAGGCVVGALTALFVAAIGAAIGAAAVGDAAAVQGGGALAKWSVGPLSEHVVEQMAARGITQRMIDAAVTKGVPYFDLKNLSVNYVLQGGGRQTLIVGQNAVSKVITTAYWTDKFNPLTLFNGVLRWIPI